eukprot:350471-Chlamydomonas_euryale.AAC.3
MKAQPHEGTAEHSQSQLRAPHSAAVARTPHAPTPHAPTPAALASTGAAVWRLGCHTGWVAILSDGGALSVRRGGRAATPRAHF